MSKLGTRAVLRQIEPGNDAHCAGCDTWVKFQARKSCRQVICNIYVRGRWHRVETYHEACYREAGEPYGPADSSNVRKKL